MWNKDSAAVGTKPVLTKYAKTLLRNALGKEDQSLLSWRIIVAGRDMERMGSEDNAANRSRPVMVITAKVAQRNALGTARHIPDSIINVADGFLTAPSPKEEDAALIWRDVLEKSARFRRKTVVGPPILSDMVVSGKPQKPAFLGLSLLKEKTSTRRFCLLILR